MASPLSSPSTSDRPRCQLPRDLTGSQGNDRATTLIGSKSYQFLGDRKLVNQLRIHVYYTIN